MNPMPSSLTRFSILVASSFFTLPCFAWPHQISTSALASSASGNPWSGSLRFATTTSQFFIFFEARNPSAIAVLMSLE